MDAAAAACSFLHYHRGGEYKDSTPLGSAPALSVDAEGAAVEEILSPLCHFLYGRCTV
jgi:hypothetical protein